MSYRYSKKRKNRNIGFFSLAILLLILFFTPLLSYLFDAFERPFLNAYEQSSQLKEKGGNFLQSLFNRSKINSEKETLKKELTLKEVDLARVDYLEQKLEKYRLMDSDLDLLGIVSAKFPFTEKNEMRVRLREDLEVELGERVYSDSHAYLGLVTEKFDHSVVIEKGTKPGKETAVVLFPQEISFTAFGDGDQYRIEAGREIEVSLGDLVFEQGSLGALVGKVSFIDFDPRHPFKEVYVSPLLSDQYIQDIYYIKK